MFSKIVFFIKDSEPAVPKNFDSLTKLTFKSLNFDDDSFLIIKFFYI